ncbi:hypothetical protein OUZ56_011471 [Daphnia magna]|uniref:Uncharacterized protein n=1 Tax=Daphnia magna TaxID=35525 RepID=A0ABQ9Z076_9CRUS|nr:hypothetical protein OUZ56_011471 [Daphnia magna]
MAIGPESLLSPGFTTGKRSLDRQTRLLMSNDFTIQLYNCSNLGEEQLGFNFGGNNRYRKRNYNKTNGVSNNNTANASI